jgi:signal transduction histidine kinase
MNYLRKLHLLLVDPSTDVAEALRRSLQGAPWEIHTVGSVDAARSFMVAQPVEAIVANVTLDGQLDYLQELATTHPETGRIALAESLDTHLAAEAINRGEVFRFFTKPWSDDNVRATLHQIRERLELRREVARLLEVTQQQNEALRAWNEQLEERVAERTRALLEAETKVAQHERLAAIGQLAGGVAHEINNPLGAITVFARTAARDLPPNHPAAGDLREIQKAANQAKKIVQSLLTFSRRTRPEERVAIDLAALLKQSQPLLQAVCKTSVDYEAGELPQVLGNASRLQQVILNLVSNADQAVGAQGRVHVKLFRENNDAILEVTDNGPGIDARHLPHIFEPFYTTKPNGSGTGLGLAIAYGIVREHGGDIAVENLTPHGTRFRVRFPAASQQKVA